MRLASVLAAFWVLSACGSSTPAPPPGGGGTPPGTGGTGAPSTGGSGGSVPMGTGGSPAGTGGSPTGTGGVTGTGGAPAGTGGAPAGTGGVAGTGGTPIASDGGPGPAADAAPAPDATVTTATFKLDGVATWRGNATAAYTIIHDDLCDSSTEGSFAKADPELVKRGLHAGFGAIVGTCESDKVWPKVKVLVSHGHDLINHSWSHSCIGAAAQCNGEGTATNDLAKELDQSTQTIKAMTGVTVQYFIFPFDVCGTAALAHLHDIGYIGARCPGRRGVTPGNFPDAFDTRFDVWGPNFSTYVAAGPCQGNAKPDQSSNPTTANSQACRSFVLKQYLDDVVKAKGWGSREMHGFDGDAGSFQPVSLADYTAHLDDIKARVDAHDLWFEGPTRVVRYRFARERCAPPEVAGGKTLHFPAPSPECMKYGGVVSYLVSASDGSDPASLSVQQGAALLPGRKLGPGRFVVDADPTAGDALLVQ
jgi:hypothetical protein